MKLSLILPLFVFLLIAHAQDCNNPLLAVFELASLDAPVPGNDLAFCDNLQGENGQTCCSATTVQSFQQRLDTLTASLQALAGERDTYMAEIFSNYTNQFQEIADNLGSFDLAVRTIFLENESLGRPIAAQVRFLQNLNIQLDTIDDDFRSAFIAYQDARQDCFTTLLEVQSNAWCLACDANYAGFFDADGNVNASPDVCNAIQSSCRPYLFDGNDLNAVYQAQQSYDRLQSLTAYLTAFINNGNTIPDTQIIDDQWTESNRARKTSGLPANCTQDNCEWLCTNLFSGQFVLNQAIAANGAGVEGAQDVRFSPLPVIIGRSGGGRLLQATEAWNPNLQGTGLEFNVEADPANVRNQLPDDGFTDDTDGIPDDETDGIPNDETDGIPDDNTDGIPDDETDGIPDDNTDGDPDTPNRRLNSFTQVFRAN